MRKLKNIGTFRADEINEHAEKLTRGITKYFDEQAKTIGNLTSKTCQEIARLVRDSERRVVAASKSPLTLSDTYELVETDSFEDSIKELMRTRDLPFTSAQNLEARLSDPSLFDIPLQSGTALIHKEKGKFRIIHNSLKLMSYGIRRRDVVNLEYVECTIPDGLMNLDINNAKYNEPLTMKEAINHPGWLCVANGNKDLLKRYATACFKLLSEHKIEKGMYFDIDSNTTPGTVTSVALGGPNRGEEIYYGQNTICGVRHLDYLPLPFIRMINKGIGTSLIRLD